MSYHNFDGVSHINDATYIDNIYSNLTDYLEWSFLNIGGFSNITQNMTNYGNDLTVLRPGSLPGYSSGQVWESAKKAWVWESGLNYSPISISGIYIDSQFYTPAATGYTISYRDGLIILDNPISTSSTVQVEYSYKLWQTYAANSNPWFYDVLFGDWINTGGNFMQVGSGAYNILSRNRVNVPFIMVEVGGRREFQGLQLGGGQILRQQALFHIVSNQSWHVNNATDYISYQNDKVLKFYNMKFVDGPYNYHGDLRPSGLTYKEMVDGYFWKKVRMRDMNIETIANAPPLYINTISCILEADFEEI